MSPHAGLHRAERMLDPLPTLAHGERVRISAICDDDEQAKRWAEKLVDGHALELWQEARKIAEFKPRKQA